MVTMIRGESVETIKLAENIVRFRREKKITQSKLAEFIGVTKASVSKWETGQSFPDLLVIPQLATYFGVTIDELMGYEPTLSTKQIKELHKSLTEEFTIKPFDEVMERTRKLAKDYYSCYLLLFFICQLWVNHCYLAKSKEEQAIILAEASELCKHIINDSGDYGLINDAILFNATIDLLLGKADDVISALKQLFEHYRFVVQSEPVLAKAYIMKNDKDKSNEFTQINMYFHLMGLVSNATQYLENNANDVDLCDVTISRIKSVIETYEFNKLHFNVAGVFYYQAAMVYVLHNRIEPCMEMLQGYVDCVKYGVDTMADIRKGDWYFDKIESMFDEANEYAGMPRDMKLVIKSVKESLNVPLFQAISNDDRYKNILKQIEKIEIKKK